jgi:hypothetical protein
MTNSPSLRASPPDQRHPLTAQRISLAVVASARVYGVDPLNAPSKADGKRFKACLAPAVVGLQMATGQMVMDICRFLAIRPTAVAGARKRGGETFLAAQAAALAAVQPTLEALPTPLPRVSKPRARQLYAPRPKPGPVTASAMIGNQPAASSVAGPALKAAEAAIKGPSFAPRPGLVVPIVRRLERAVRMLPVTASKLRFARRFLDARWDLEEIAELFDVSPDALAAAFQSAAA